MVQLFSNKKPVGLKDHGIWTLGQFSHPFFSKTELTGKGWVYEPLSSGSSKNPFWSLDSNKFKEPSVPDFGKVSESEEPWFQFTGTGEFSQNS